MSSNIDRCKHEYIRQDHGRVFTSYGEYTDNLEEDYICIHCYRYMSEIEEGETYGIEVEYQEQFDDDDNYTYETNTKELGDNYD